MRNLLVALNAKSSRVFEEKLQRSHFRPFVRFHFVDCHRYQVYIREDLRDSVMDKCDNRGERSREKAARSGKQQTSQKKRGGCILAMVAERRLRGGRSLPREDQKEAVENNIGDQRSLSLTQI